MSCCSEQCKQKLVYGVSVLGAFLIMAAIVQLTRHYTAPAPADTTRAEERAKNLKELNAATTQVLTHYDWQDKPKGFVRLPVERAKELVLQEYQNPAKARALLAERTDKLNAAPPKAPEAKSPFE
jgi:hypothetical protein